MRILSILAGIILGSGQAWALSCAPPLAEKAYKQHDAVFVGAVKEIRKVKWGWKNPLKMGQTRYFTAIIRVQKVYKGNLPANIEVKDDAYWPVFSEGRDYLVFAMNRKDGYWNEICSGTATTEYSAESLQVLDRLTKQKK